MNKTQKLFVLAYMLAAPLVCAEDRLLLNIDGDITYEQKINARSLMIGGSAHYYDNFLMMSVNTGIRQYFSDKYCQGIVGVTTKTNNKSLSIGCGFRHNMSDNISIDAGIKSVIWSGYDQSGAYTATFLNIGYLLD